MAGCHEHANGTWLAVMNNNGKWLAVMNMVMASGWLS